MTHPIILDACTIINLLRIDNEDEFFFKAIGTLDIHIAKMVYEEVVINIKKNYLSEDQCKYIEQVIPEFVKFSRKNDAIINDLSEEFFSNLCKFTHHTKKQNGELLSSALSLCISREKNTTVSFYTDDFPAKQQFSNFFIFQQIGNIGDSVDLLLFLYWTKSDFNIKQLKKILQDLKSEYNTPMKKLIGKIQKIKDSLSIKERKDRNLIVNIDRIINGYYDSDSKLMIEGVNFFDKNQKYQKINIMIKEFPDVTKDCLLAQKIHSTIQSLSTYEIFKVA